jgi:hypothetical protein
VKPTDAKQSGRTFGSRLACLFHTVGSFFMSFRPPSPSPSLLYPGWRSREGCSTYVDLLGGCRVEPLQIPSCGSQQYGGWFVCRLVCHLTGVVLAVSLNGGQGRIQYCNIRETFKLFSGTMQHSRSEEAIAPVYVGSSPGLITGNFARYEVRTRREGESENLRRSREAIDNIHCIDATGTRSNEHWTAEVHINAF